ncbi:2-succinyl-6-hydroxy-2,4-cyclohexadiene-1-carboxylate synthase [Paenibacillus endoradicis]|uniref:2-succinyl-6-hydroxy-2, 4-cyclohexadiene-1-carboxylate synthase n=1 Tax=Paenibacillus endoradicis TaxID=2972487 RepID=UPI0021598E10|nr:2-succinyl-6-hydroxy-2,4-cyclohexadiene-1-carboxylate synthase [Paenibacillus endoradicis]MCR8658499.1 2-succinyl-6-hydroxy-2,4-cyclohexadiene-1-carboxylate synthase [Paenibacillus endoradicis]
MKYIINGATYYVELHGEGQALLLLHGFSGNHEQWTPFIESWTAEHQLIIVDLLGHGKSEANADYNRYHTEQTVTDLVELLDQLYIESAIVLGYSMGGRIALSMAQLAPSKVNGLILESTSPGLASLEERQARMDSDEALASKIEQHGIDWFADYWAELPLFASLKLLPLEEQEAIDQQRRSNKPQGLANSLRGIGTGAQPSWWDHMEHITKPTLLIVGESDMKFRKIAELMMQRMNQPYKQLEIVSEAGHNVHMEQPHKFDTIVKRYLSMRKGMV